MAKTTAEKLLIKPNTPIWSSSDAGLDDVGALPEGVRRVADPEQAVMALIFAEDASSLRSVLAANARAIAGLPATWIAYRKGKKTDLNRDSVWPIASEFGLRPMGQGSIGDGWSAIRFRPLAPGEAPFDGRP